LIVIDNGSTDQTGAYLEGVQDGAAVPVTAIRNRINRGFPAAINQGLKGARDEYLVLLNNDVVVTDGWLGQLIALADMGKERGKREGDLAGCSGSTPPGSLHSEACVTTPPSQGGERAHMRAAFMGSGWWGRCRTTRRRRSWSRMCLES
jgi:glycosyltransferase involved in cell wall biosynthesis